MYKLEGNGKWKIKGARNVFEVTRTWWYDTLMGRHLGDLVVITRRDKVPYRTYHIPGYWSENTMLKSRAPGG
jgi:hypothetical protein